MDRNSIIGFLLIGAVLILFAWLNKTNKPTVHEKTKTEQVQTVKNDTSKRMKTMADTSLIQKDTATRKDTAHYPHLFARFLNGHEEVVTLENELIEVKISGKGGRILYARLKNYKDFDKKPLVLFNGDESKFSYDFAFENKIISSGDLYFHSNSKPVFVKGHDSASVIMRLSVNDSQYIEHIYTIFGNNYMLNSSIRLVGFNKIIPEGSNYFDLKWTLKTRYLERKMTKRYENITGTGTTIYYKNLNEVPDKLQESKDIKKDIAGNIKWVAFKQQFFTSVLIAKDNFTRGLLEKATSTDTTHGKTLAATLSFPFDHQKNIESYDLSYYFGPIHYKTLKRYDLDLERQVFLGRGLLRWINIILIIPVFNFLSGFIGNYGIIILLLTIFIKIILLPLTYKSYLSTAKMKVLKPEIDAIKAKVGSDMTKQQAETMKLYRSVGVSPFGGCLPMLLQMPILIAMFRFFPSSIELRQQSFLWATDLSTYDSIWNFPNGFKIPGYGDHISLFTLLMTISTIIYTKMNSDMMGGQETQKQMKVLQYIMPVMFLGFFNNYSAGLSYYYLLANVLTFGQQYFFKLFVKEENLLKQIELNRQKKSRKPKSKWQQRLEELQKQQRRR